MPIRLLRVLTSTLPHSVSPTLSSSAPLTSLTLFLSVLSFVRKAVSRTAAAASTFEGSIQDARSLCVVGMAGHAVLPLLSQLVAVTRIYDVILRARPRDGIGNTDVFCSFAAH